MSRDLSVRVVMLILAWFWVLLVEPAMVEAAMVDVGLVDGGRDWQMI